jgi:hypothetical protein
MSSKEGAEAGSRRVLPTYAAPSDFALLVLAGGVGDKVLGVDGDTRLFQ